MGAYRQGTFRESIATHGGKQHGPEVLLTSDDRELTIIDTSTRGALEIARRLHDRLAHQLRFIVIEKFSICRTHQQSAADRLKRNDGTCTSVNWSDEQSKRRETADLARWYLFMIEAMVPGQRHVIDADGIRRHITGRTGSQRATERTQDSGKASPLQSFGHAVHARTERMITIGLRSMKNTYLTLAIVGAVIPYAFFLPFFQNHGLDITEFSGALFASAPASGFTADLLISSLVFWLFMFQQQKMASAQAPAPRPYWYLLLNLTIGLSCALPAYLYACQDD